MLLAACKSVRAVHEVLCQLAWQWPAAWRLDSGTASVSMHALLSMQHATCSLHMSRPCIHWMHWAGHLTAPRGIDDNLYLSGFCIREAAAFMCRYVGGLIPGSTDADLHDAFYKFGEITSIRVIELRRCAFVTFAERSQAEKAAEELSNKLLIRGQRVKVMWGKPQQRPDGGAVPPSMLPPQVGSLHLIQPANQAGQAADDRGSQASKAQASMDAGMAEMLQPGERWLHLNLPGSTSGSEVFDGCCS